MDEKVERALILAVVVGIAAGTAATVTSIVFPCVFKASRVAFQARKRRDQREHKQRPKLEKVKKLATQSEEHQMFKEIIQQALIKWEDIKISLESFPYFLLDETKKAIFDAMYVFLKKPIYAKSMSDFVSFSPRILLTGPPGSEIVQELLVKALAHKLQVNILVLDCRDVLLEAREVRLPDKVNIQGKQYAPVSLAGIDLNGEYQSKSGKSSASLLTSKSILQMKSPDMGLRSVTQWLGQGLLDSNKDKALPSMASSNSMMRGTTTGPSKCIFKKGDRVRYVGQNNGSSSASLVVSSYRGSSGSKGPSIGAKGRVILVVEDNPRKVGVRFDKPFYGGNNMVDLCEDGHGYFCNVSELRLEHSVGEDENKAMFDALVEVLTLEASKGPLILFIKDVERAVLSNPDLYKRLEQIEKWESRMVLVGSQTRCFQKDQDNFFSWIDDIKGEVSTPSKPLSKLLPTRIYLHPPQDPCLAMEWNKQMEKDIERLKAEENRRRLRLVIASSGILCNDLDKFDNSNPMLTHEMAEKVVGWAVSQQAQKDHEEPVSDGKLFISTESLQRGLKELVSVQRSPPLRQLHKDIAYDNEFERLLATEVVSPHELGVTFDSIGALENVKEALREQVMLPLQRPELFATGQLRKPCRGLLLFGPPGTGKTMLAKAVATEAGANFVNISMSSITSKWFGETGKFVKALFSLAYKIAPTVIFIDEVDSMLGRRGSDSEHRAMRRLKNEFMAHWDGLRTRDDERVLVLAATNRPFDLDEAVIRRFSRRLMVDLPDTENRAKILKVILEREDLAPEFNIEELAAATDGYSGSDLKNLCIAAAYQPIRELLEKEKKETREAESNGQTEPSSKQTIVRPISMADMSQAIKMVRSSVSSEAQSVHDLQRWNEQYGEGGVRKTVTPSYFI
eukprot:TRINITY_DN1741_c0_g1_i3.p1 TRINITY_DN1741_c0_g1~~TRINITY_DN1741_c0_g1_i3.p1  ORF type:complete len:906 (-),score=232.97 TRINITY_DN1741_c0_g1_i3:288-3005(-)